MKNQKNQPLYVARKSGFSVLNPWLLLTSIFIIPLIIQLWKIGHAKTFKLMVYENRIVTKRGLIFVKEETHGFYVGLVRMNTYRGFWGNLLDFGTVTIECIGRADVVIRGIFDPKTLGTVLEEHFVDPRSTQTLLVNN